MIQDMHQYLEGDEDYKRKTTQSIISMNNIFRG